MNEKVGKMKLSLVMQIKNADNGAAALATMLGYYGKYVSLRQMRDVCYTSRNGSSPEQILRAAEYFGLKAELKTTSFEELKSVKLPVMVCWKKKYYTVVTKITKKTVALADPAKGNISVSVEKFAHAYSGRSFKLCPTDTFRKDGVKESDLRTIWGRISKHKGNILVLWGLSLCMTFLTIRYIKEKSLYMDRVVSGENPELYTRYVIILSLFLIAKLVVSILTELYDYRISRKAAAENSAEFLHSFLYLPISFFEKNSSGEILNRLNSSINIDSTLIITIVPKLFRSVSLVFYLVSVFFYNVRMTTVLIMVYILLTWAIMAVQKRTIMINRSNISSADKMRTTLMQGLNNIDTIKASGAEEKFFHLWAENQRELRNNTFSMAKLNGLEGFLNTIQNNLMSAIMLFMGAYLIIKGELTLGVLSAFQSVFSNVASSADSLLSLSRQIQKSTVDIERANDLLQEPKTEEVPWNLAPDEDAEKLTGKVEIKNLSYRYNPMDPLVLDNISFDIHPGEMVALVGSSGCGKSTLMKIIADIYQIDDGSVLYDGKPRNKIPDVIFHNSIATVDQDMVFFADTVENNLKLWDTTIEDYEMILAAWDAHIHDRIMQNPYGYSSDISTGGRNYSGGEKQRMELARALSIEPNLLILDEFTSALDTITEDKIFSSLRKKNVACLIAAHRLSTVAQCDKIIAMDNGKIVEIGTHEELYSKHGLYYSLVNAG